MKFITHITAAICCACTASGSIGADIVKCREMYGLVRDKRSDLIDSLFESVSYDGKTLSRMKIADVVVIFDHDEKATQITYNFSAPPDDRTVNDLLRLSCSGWTKPREAMGHSMDREKPPLVFVSPDKKLAAVLFIQPSEFRIQLQVLTKERVAALQKAGNRGDFDQLAAWLPK